jgi:type I restriction enzyme S subunit
LEQQAQALYKSWFVDFEPFREGEFVESELGRIPKGWRVAKIKDIPHTLNTGKRPKGGAIASGVPSIGAEQLKGLCNYDYAKTKYISKEYSQSIPKGKVIGYEVYLNRVGGKPGDYIQNTTMFGEGYPYENCYINDHVFKLDFMQNRGYNVYIYFTFLTSRIKKYLNACGGKAAIPVINKQNIDDIYVFLPENEYVIKFGKSILPIMNIIFKNGLESARLAELRDMLLPKLMSGEINVNEVKI